MEDIIASLGTAGRWPILAFIPLFPLLGAIVNGLVLRPGRASRAWVEATALAMVGISFVLAVVSFVALGAQHAHDEGGRRLFYHAWDWFQISMSRGGDVGIIDLRVAFLMDELSGTMTLIVTGIGLLIHVFSTGYMRSDEGYHRYFAFLNLFLFAMLVLVLGNSLPMLFVGWEGVGLCSYLLIGFWFDNPAYAAAGKKAFIVNRIGDVGVLLAMFVIATYCHTLDFSDVVRSDAVDLSIRASASSLDIPFAIAVKAGQPIYLPFTAATLACVCLFIGCAGKSAQIPLYVWLPDAMAGPTPVSALIHAATMVTAGVYLVCRMSFLFALSPSAMAIVATVGALTALLAASIGLVQNQMKKVLAYSTVSQLGFMFLAAGVGAYGAAMFHVFTHAFFKACLFLGAGAVMHSVGAHGDVDVTTLGGLSKKLRWTHLTFAVAALALAGFPLTSGFFSKDEILFQALSVRNPVAPWLNPVLFGIGVAAACMTAFYIGRVYVLTFRGQWRGGPAHEHDEPSQAHEHGEAPGAGEAAALHEEKPIRDPDSSMTGPLIILATGAALAGLLGRPRWTGLPNVWERWIEPSFAGAPVPGGTEVAAAGEAAGHALDTTSIAIALAAGLLAMATGLGLAWAWYDRGDGSSPKRLAQSVPWLHRTLFAKCYVDEAYDLVIVRPMAWISRALSTVDRVIVDGILVEVTTAVLRAVGYLLTRLQTGRVQAYGAMMVVGLAGVVWWFSAPHASLRAHVEGNRVTFTAGAGPGYSYRWRPMHGTRPDEPFPADWVTDREMTRAFPEQGHVRVRVEVRNAFGRFDREIAEVDVPAPGSGQPAEHAALDPQARLGTAGGR